MRLVELKIDNFRAIRSAEFLDLGPMVVIAGPNGCGKSAVLDAIRLLKSACGGYRPGELQQFFSEFKLQYRPGAYPADRLLRDPTGDLRISAHFRLAHREREHLREHAPELLRPYIVREVAPEREREDVQGYALVGAGSDLTTRIEEQLAAEVNEFGQLLDQTEDLTASVTSDRENRFFRYEASPVLQLLFSTYAPGHLGVFEFHGANRAYEREQLGGVNLGTSERPERTGQHALYQTENKYKNIKREMASTYVREMIARQAGIEPPAGTDLTSALKSLFDTFFPGKEFLGPLPTAEGQLALEVRLPSGEQHDIDELSSGEKEILYGYLRLRDMEPRSSILLFDEPELHLNPRLARDLPEFYQNYLGKPFDNQVIIVTHSDAFLREAVKRDEFSIFHMQPAERSVDNQVSRVEAKEELQRAVIDLVGEMADYTPPGKVVIVEGGGDAEFDREMVRSLFPVFAEGVNIVSSGNTRRVQQLHDLLQKADAGRHKFFSIRDKDYAEAETGVPEVGRYQWDVYHIENYLVEPRFVMQVMDDLGHTRTTFSNEGAVDEALQACAEGAVEEIVRERVEFEAKRRLAACIKTGSDRAAPIATAVGQAIGNSESRLAEAVDLLMKGGLAEMEGQWRGYWEESLQDGSWRGHIPGEKILRRFAGMHIGELRYERFRSLILAQMRNAGYQPEGMRRIINAIEEAEAG